MWRETSDLSGACARESTISIHSLRVEGDIYIRHHRDHSQISIHSLRVEGDWRNAKAAIAKAAISIHSLRVEGDGEGSGKGRDEEISIHSLRVEGDGEGIGNGRDE